MKLKKGYVFIGVFALFLASTMLFNYGCDECDREYICEEGSCSMPLKDPPAPEKPEYTPIVAKYADMLPDGFPAQSASEDELGAYFTYSLLSEEFEAYLQKFQNSAWTCTLDPYKDEKLNDLANTLNYWTHIYESESYTVTIAHQRYVYTRRMRETVRISIVPIVTPQEPEKKEDLGGGY